MTRPLREARRIWTAPVIIGVATLVGVVGALVAEDAWDWAAALLLFAVLAYAVGLGLRSRQPRPRLADRQGAVSDPIRSSNVAVHRPAGQTRS